MIYEWKCKNCQTIHELSVYSSSTPIQCSCGGELKRFFGSVQLNTSSAFKPHFNHSVGEYVSNERDFRSALARKADENSLRTGTDHHYVPIMPGDMPQPKQDTEIFETRNKIVKDKGLTHEYGEIT